MSDKLSLTVFPNGPIKVSDAKTINFLGKPVEFEGDVFLCRCGKSAKAPFCDGTHGKCGFDGSSQGTGAKDIKVWEGSTLRTYFNPNTCMHVLYCKPLKELRAKELAGDASAAKEIMAVVATCPSGALTYETKIDAQKLPLPTANADIDIIEGGEARIQCAFEINTELNERQHVERATLCRCGLSKNKPWCDGRHMGAKDFV